LDKLAEANWVESHIEVQEDRPNRKIYSITEAGRAELDRWLQAEQRLSPYRESFLVLLFFAGQLSDEHVLMQLEAQLEKHQRRLTTYREIDIPRGESPRRSRIAAFQQMTLDLGIRSEETAIAWLKDCIAQITQKSG
jgi:hypothetical protein